MLILLHFCESADIRKIASFSSLVDGKIVSLMELIHIGTFVLFRLAIINMCGIKYWSLIAKVGLSS